MLLTANSSALLSGKALGLDGRVVAELVNLANLVVGQLGRLLAVSAAVDGDDDSTTETEVVLQRVLGLGDLTVVGPTAQVPDKLGALGDTGRTERVALGDEAARGVDEVFAAVGDVAVADKLVSLALLTQAKGLEDNHLVGGEAVVQLNNLDVVGGNLGLVHGNLDGVLGHAVAHQVNRALGEQAGVVGGKALAGNLDSLRLEVWAGIEESLGDDDGGSTTVRSRAALELGEGLKDGLGLHDLFAGVDLLELRVGVVGRVGMVDTGNLRKVLGLCAVLFHVFAAGVAKHLGGAGGRLEAASLDHHVDRRADGVLAVVEEALQAAGHHLFEADDEDTVGGAAGHKRAAHGQTCAAGRAVIVDVVDGDLGHAELVEDALAAGAVAVAVAGNALLDVVVADLGVKHGLDSGLEAELGVVDIAAGLDELGHAHAQDVDGLLLLGGHGCGYVCCRFNFIRSGTSVKGEVRK